MMNRFRNLFYGRNGTDQLSMATSTCACILLVVAMFLKGTASSVLWMLAFLFLILTYFRMFSRNLPRRQAENARFLNLIEPLARKFRLARTKRQQKHLYRFFKCPSCDTVLRVPVGKGHIRITCKNCGHVFERNT